MPKLLNSTTGTSEVRIYRKPSLAKGPLLTGVTALPTVSGANDFCWVARAAFGENDLRWMIFREWLLVGAPAWFRNLYIRHGEAIGAWLQDRPLPRAAVRGLMTPAIRRVMTT
jgi:hypothetical protein